MKINQHTYIYGQRVILVPYEKHHVPKYHEWMRSGELQKLTASEPLSLEEEYSMQASWRDDENKCTFIVLDASKYRESVGLDGETEAMVGDVNLFFNDSGHPKSAELEIMIAEPSARGRGMGKEALFSMLRYGMHVLQVDRFTAKIGYSNIPSIHLFHKIGFIEVSRSDVFEEVTLELPLTDDAKQLIMNETHTWNVQNR